MERTASRSGRPGAAAAALAVTISWLAAGAVVIGLAWTASTLSPHPHADAPEGPLSYTLGWTAASVAMLGASFGSLLTEGRLRRALLGLACIMILALLGFALAGGEVFDS